MNCTRAAAASTTTMSDSQHLAPQQYGPRLVRAISLVTVGATMHTLLGLDPFGPPPAIRPLKVVHAAPRPAPRPLLLERSTVFAPQVREPGASSQPARRGPAATSGIVRGDRSAGLTGVQRLVDWLSAVQASPPAHQPTAMGAAVGTAVGTSGSTPPGDLHPVTEARIEVAALTAAGDVRKLQPAEDAAGDPGAAPPVLTATVGRPLELSGIEPVERLARRPAPSRAEVPAAPVSAAPVESSMKSGADSLPIGPSEEALVRQLIDEYAGAYERLDVGAIKAVRPTVDDKALKRAFERLSAQRLTLQSCGITISGSTANARCRGSASYQPRIGNRVYEIASGEWTFALSKKDAAWKIVDTLVQ